MEIVFFQDDDNEVPVIEWLEEMGRRDRRIVAKLQALIQRLEEEGHELRRPASDILRDGIHELRVKFGSVNYRILYFFHGRNTAILVHGLTKQDTVPSRDIDLAVSRKNRYISDPIKYRFEEDEADEEADE